MSLRWGVSVACAVLFLGCPPAVTVDVGIDVDAGDEVDQFCGVYSAGRCDHLARCGQLHDRASCVAQFVQTCERYFGRRVRTGAWRLTADAGDSCAEGWRASACTWPVVEPRECGVVAEALGEDGRTCFDQFECASGSCARDAGSDCGVCSRFDGPCSCTDSQYCSALGCLDKVVDGRPCSSSSQCSSGVCNSSRVCGVRAEGEGCGRNEDCAFSHFCSVAADAGTCQVRRAVGSACSQSYVWYHAECEPGSVCLDGFCATYDGGMRPDGAECARGGQCASGVCSGEFGIGTKPGLCATPRVGGPCIANTAECPANSACVHAPGGGTCLPVAGLGESCTVGSLGLSQCKAGLTCVDSKCVVPLSPGSACVSDAQCWCVSGFCRGPGPSGASCRGDSDCQAGHCLLEGQSVGRCIAECR